MRPFSLYTSRMDAPFTRSQLYNCCTGEQEPDWTQFKNLELGGCIDAAGPGETSTAIEGGIDRAKAEFFTIYGRLTEGGCEAITDCANMIDAEHIGLYLCKLSSLSLEIVC